MLGAGVQVGHQQQQVARLLDGEEAGPAATIRTHTAHCSDLLMVADLGTVTPTASSKHFMAAPMAVTSW